MNKKIGIILCSLIGAALIALAIYSGWFFSTTLSEKELEPYAIEYSKRGSQEFLKTTDTALGEEFVFFVSRQTDPTQTQSQELFVFKEKKSIIPFAKRYYKYTSTAGSQMYLPVDALWFTPNGGNNLDVLLQHAMIFYSANDQNISKVDCIISTANGEETQSKEVSADQAFFLNFYPFGNVNGINKQFVKANFYGSDGSLIYTFGQ